MKSLMSSAVPATHANWVAISLCLMGDVEVGELEYETIAAFGPRCGVYDYEHISMANYYVSIYGMDTISAGATVSAAMEWYEKGILTKDDLDGLDLHFGNGEAMVELIRKMCLREGCGDLFADGSAWASKRIGEESKPYLMAVKGMEISASDPRGAVSMAIAFAPVNGALVICGHMQQP